MSNEQLETKSFKIISIIAPKNEILGYKSNKTCTRSTYMLKLQNANETNRRMYVSYNRKTKQNKNQRRPK